MSDQTYVVMPIRADGSSSHQDANEMANAIENSINEKFHPNDHEHYGQGADADNQEHGPLRRVIDEPGGLYKYISWEDPIRTLESYFALLGLLCGIHYLHCTRLLLKIAATALGAVSLASFVSRSTKSDLVSRLRPEYKKVPEPALNATLSDLHDLVQYVVVQAQKVLYGEDLEKTFGAFLTLTTLFWLIKVVSPFKLEILGLSTMFVAPLLASPTSRELAHGMALHAQGLARIAMQDGAAKALDLSHKTQQAAGGLASKTQKSAGNWVSGTQHVAGDLASKTQKSAGSLFSGTQHLAADLSSRAQKTVGNLRFGSKQEEKGFQATGEELQPEEEVAGANTRTDIADANMVADGGGSERQQIAGMNAQPHVVDVSGGREEKQRDIATNGKSQIEIANGGTNGTPLGGRVHS